MRIADFKITSKPITPKRKVEMEANFLHVKQPLSKRMMCGTSIAGVATT